MTSSQHPQRAPEGIDLKDGGDDLSADLVALNRLAVRIAGRISPELQGTFFNDAANAVVLTTQILNDIVNTKTGSGQ